MYRWAAIGRGTRYTHHDGFPGPMGGSSLEDPRYFPGVVTDLSADAARTLWCGPIARPAWVAHPSKEDRFRRSVGGEADVPRDSVWFRCELGRMPPPITPPQAVSPAVMPRAPVSLSSAASAFAAQRAHRAADSDRVPVG